MNPKEDDVEEKVASHSNDIRQDPTITRLLDRMPKATGESFSDEQLLHIRNAIGSRNWGNHTVDSRGVFKIPLLSWQVYYVFLIGKNRRELSTREIWWANILGTVFVVSATTFAILFVLLVLYLLKSAAGIDLFPNFSLGIWHWFKANVF